MKCRTPRRRNGRSPTPSATNSSPARARRSATAAFSRSATRSSRSSPSRARICRVSSITGQKFRRQVQAPGAAWLDGELSVSFRSTAPVLALTDAVFAQGPARRGVCLPDEPLRPWRQPRGPGRVGDALAADAGERGLRSTRLVGARRLRDRAFGQIPAGPADRGLYRRASRPGPAEPRPEKPGRGISWCSCGGAMSWSPPSPAR